MFIDAGAKVGNPPFQSTRGVQNYQNDHIDKPWNTNDSALSDNKLNHKFNRIFRETCAEAFVVPFFSPFLTVFFFFFFFTHWRD